MADGGIIHRTKEKDNGTYCTAKISFMIVHYVENKSFFFVDKNSCPQRELSIPCQEMDAVPVRLSYQGTF